MKMYSLGAFYQVTKYSISRIQRLNTTELNILGCNQLNHMPVSWWPIATNLKTYTHFSLVDIGVATLQCKVNKGICLLISIYVILSYIDMCSIPTGIFSLINTSHKKTSLFKETIPPIPSFVYILLSNPHEENVFRLYYI